MTTAESTEATTGTRGGSRGPRVYKSTPTPRERVLSESLARKVKEVTGREVSAETVRAVRWSFSRWYDDPATKQLMNDMDSELKKAKAREKYEKAQAALREAQAELGDIDDDEEDSDGSFDATDEDEEEDADEDDSDDEDDDDVFDDDKVSASF